MNDFLSPFSLSLFKTPRINLIPRKEFEIDTAQPCLPDTLEVSPSCTTPAAYSCYPSPRGGTAYIVIVTLRPLFLKPIQINTLSTSSNISTF